MSELQSSTAEELPNSVTQKWLTVEQAAEYLQLSHNTVRRILHDGLIKAAKIGHFRIEKADLDSWLSRQKKTIPPYRKGTRPAVAARHARNRKRASR